MESPALFTRLSLLEIAGDFAICRLDPAADIPDWATQGAFFSITRTPEELSVACLKDQVPTGVTCETGWRGLQVKGPLDLSLVGVLASIAQPLAEAGISIFALGTYETDYILVRQRQYEEAMETLEA